MENMKQYLVPAVVSLVVVVFFSIVSPRTVVNQIPGLGAVVGPDSSFPCESHNGVTRCFNRQVMNTATTTVCSFKTPSATSTLVAASARWSVSSTTATTVYMAKGAGTNASTTLVVSGALGANAFGTLVASTTSTGAVVDGTNVFAPNIHLNYGMTGGTGTFSPTGVCQATFEVVN